MGDRTPLGDMIYTASPFIICMFLASSIPRMMPGLSGNFGSSVWGLNLFSRGTVLKHFIMVPADSGSMPLKRAPDTVAGERSITWEFTKGVAANTFFVSFIFRILSLYPENDHPLRLITIWESIPRIRDFMSDSKPAMPAITTINAITPTVTPATERILIKDIKASFCRVLK